MKQFDGDAVIVGAGPSGALAAHDLARAGKRVLLLDKAAFPRMKPCAGGLTMRAVHMLPYSVAPVTERICTDFLARFGNAQTVFPGRAPVVHMTVRATFDAFNLQKAREAGALFHHIGPISAITREGAEWTVHTADGVFRAPHLIGADGANSRVRKLCLPETRGFAFAAEAVVPVPNPTDFPMEMDFGATPQGYAWIFPKGDHLNVGIYALGPTRGLKSDLIAWCRDRLGRDIEPGEVVGHRIPIGGHGFQPAPEDPLLVGDAAGVADPFFGEGIYNALKSGRAAAAAILAADAGDSHAYARLVAPVRRDLAAYWWITRAFYRKPAWGYRLLCLPPVRAALMKGVALGWTTRKTLYQCYRLPFAGLPPRT